MLDHWLNLISGCGFADVSVTAAVVITNDSHLPLYNEWLQSRSQCPSPFAIEVVSDGSTTNDNRRGAVEAMAIGSKTLRQKGDHDVMMVIAGDLLFDNMRPGLSSSFHDFLRCCFDKASEPSTDGVLVGYRLSSTAELRLRGVAMIEEQTERVKTFREKPSDPDLILSQWRAVAPFYLLGSRLEKQLDVFLESHQQLLDRDTPGQFLQFLFRDQQEGEGWKVPLLSIHGRQDIGNLQQLVDALVLFGVPVSKEDRFFQISDKTMRLEVTAGRGHARAALAGNPSDGYGGSTIALLVKEFAAEVVASPSNNGKLQIEPHPFFDGTSFQSFDDLQSRWRQRGRPEGGIVGAIPLLQASALCFFRLLEEKWGSERTKQVIGRRPMPRLSYNTNIPVQVGMAGSSALIVACLRALLAYLHVDPFELEPKREMWPQHVLDVERKELKISAGLQDRVAQVYGGITLMDFSTDLLSLQGHGTYESIPIDQRFVDNLFVVHLIDQPEYSGKVHSDLRARYEAGDQNVFSLVLQFRALCGSLSAELVGFACDATEADVLERKKRIAKLIDRNFDLRRELLGDRVIGDECLRMVEAVRSLGLCCNFTGSGGALICAHDPAKMWPPLADDNLSSQLAASGFAFHRVSVMTFPF